MRDMARRRNVGVMERVNDYLDTVRLDYDTDVLPLTPSGNATERHMLAAYDAKARAVIGEPGARGILGEGAEHWRDRGGCSARQHAGSAREDALEADEVRRRGVRRRRSSETFPTVDTVIEMIKGIDALPTMTWLDGTSPGESDMPALLGLMVEKGVVALNIVPDRNWNIKNADEKRVKVENLGKVIDAARKLDLPLCVGTELNKLGLPFVDDFSAPELAPYVADFIEGAHFFWGHTFLARKAGIGFASDWADAHFGTERAAENAFYAEVGRLAGPNAEIDGIDLPNASPREIIRAL